MKKALHILYLIFFSLGLSAQLSEAQEGAAQEMNKSFSEDALVSFKAYQDVYSEKCEFQELRQRQEMYFFSETLDRALQLRGLDKEFKNSFRKGYKLGFEKGLIKGSEGDFKSRKEFCNCIHSVVVEGEYDCMQ